MIIGVHVLHHSIVRTQFIEKLKHHTLDTLIAVGNYNNHTNVELFSTIFNSKWQNKEDYPYSKDIYMYSILAVKRTFIIFGGMSQKRSVLTDQDIKIIKIFRKYHYFITVVNSTVL